jgi:hypothetical protein
MPSFTPTLTHSMNTSGRMGMYVDPYSCPCSGCRDYLAGNYENEEQEQVEEPGLSNRSPLAPPTSLNLQRQTAVGFTSPDRTPPFSALSPSASSDLSPTPTGRILPTRSNGGGIPWPPALEPTPTGLGNWRMLLSRFSADSDDTAPHPNLPPPTYSSSAPDPAPAPAPSPAPAEHSGLCTCAPCVGEDEITGMSLDLKEELMEHLYSYLSMLEKQKKMMDAKMDFYAFLFEDASLHLRTQHLSKKILNLKKTINTMEGEE